MPKTNSANFLKDNRFAVKSFAQITFSKLNKSLFSKAISTVPAPSDLMSAEESLFVHFIVPQSDSLNVLKTSFELVKYSVAPESAKNFIIGNLGMFKLLGVKSLTLDLLGLNICDTKNCVDIYSPLSLLFLGVLELAFP